MRYRFERSELERARNDPKELGRLIEESAGFALPAMLQEGLEPELPTLLESLSRFSAGYILERFPLTEEIRERLQPMFRRSLPGAEERPSALREAGLGLGSGGGEDRSAESPEASAERALREGVLLREGTILAERQLKELQKEIAAQAELDEYAMARILAASTAGWTADRMLGLGEEFLAEHPELLARRDLMKDPRLKRKYREILEERAQKNGGGLRLSDFGKWPFAEEDREFLDGMLDARAESARKRSLHSDLWSYERFRELPGAKDLYSPLAYALRHNPFDLGEVKEEEIGEHLPRIRGEWLRLGEEAGWSAFPDFACEIGMFERIVDRDFLKRHLESESAGHLRDFHQEGVGAEEKIRHLKLLAIEILCGRIEDGEGKRLGWYSASSLAKGLLSESHRLGPEDIERLAGSFAKAARALCRSSHPEFAEFAEFASEWMDPRLMPGIGRLCEESPSANLLAALAKARGAQGPRRGRREEPRGGEALGRILESLGERVPLGAALAVRGAFGVPKLAGADRALGAFGALALWHAKGLGGAGMELGKERGGEPAGAMGDPEGNLWAWPPERFGDLPEGTRRLWLSMDKRLPERLDAAGLEPTDEDVAWALRSGRGWGKRWLSDWGMRAFLAAGEGCERYPSGAAAIRKDPILAAEANLPDPEDAEDRLRRIGEAAGEIEALKRGKADLKRRIEAGKAAISEDGEDYDPGYFGWRRGLEEEEAEAEGPKGAIEWEAAAARLPDPMGLGAKEGRAALLRLRKAESEGDRLLEERRREIAGAAAELTGETCRSRHEARLGQGAFRESAELGRARPDLDLGEGFAKFLGSMPARGFAEAAKGDMAFAEMLRDLLERKRHLSFLDFGSERENREAALAAADALGTEQDPMGALRLFRKEAMRGLASELAIETRPMDLLFNYRMRPKMSVSEDDPVGEYLSAEQVLRAWDAAEASSPGGVLNRDDANASLSHFWPDQFRDRPEEYLRLVELSRARPTLHLALICEEMSVAVESARESGVEGASRRGRARAHCEFAAKAFDWEVVLEGFAEVARRQEAAARDPEGARINDRLADGLVSAMVWATYWDESDGKGGTRYHSAFPRDLSARILREIVEKAPGKAYSLHVVGDIVSASDFLAEHMGSFAPEGRELETFVFPSSAQRGEHYSTSGRFEGYAKSILAGYLSDAAARRPEECAFLLWTMRDKEFQESELNWEARHEPLRFVEAPKGERMEEFLEMIGESEELMRILKAGADRSWMAKALGSAGSSRGARKRL